MRRPTSAHTGRQAAETRYASPLDMVVEQTEKQRSLISTAAERMGTSPDKLLPLLRNIWKTSKGTEPLSDQELTAGIALIAKYDLDPFTRELYVSRANDGRLFTIVGIDGWVKILDRTDHYDGFEQVHGEDEIGEFVETTIYSKKRTHPTTYRAHMETWKALGGFMWNKIGHHMLTLLSLRHAARLFSPVGGSVVTEEEFEMAAGTRMVAMKQRQSGTLDELLASSSGKQEKNGDAGQIEDNKDKPFISQERFDELCGEHQITEGEIRDAKQSLGFDGPLGKLHGWAYAAIIEKVLETRSDKQVAEADALFSPEAK